MSRILVFAVAVAVAVALCICILLALFLTWIISIQNLPFRLRRSSRVYLLDSPLYLRILLMKLVFGIIARSNYIPALMLGYQRPCK